MLTDNNQIFRNWFVIIQRHLTKVSAYMIQCIIFERNELSITLSTLWCTAYGTAAEPFLAVLTVLSLGKTNSSIICKK